MSRRLFAGRWPLVAGRLLAAMNRILLALFRSRVILIPSQQIRNAQIGLLNPPQHLLVQLLLKRFGTFHRRVGVGILGVQVGPHPRILLVLHPRIVVHPAVSMEDVLHRLPFRQRRLHLPSARASHRCTSHVLRFPASGPIHKSFPHSLPRSFFPRNKPRPSRFPNRFSPTVRLSETRRIAVTCTRSGGSP